MFCPDTFADITGSDTHWQDTAVLILVDNNRAFCAKVYCYNAVAVDISARVAGYISLVGKIEYRAAVRLAVTPQIPVPAVRVGENFLIVWVYVGALVVNLKQKP